MFLALLAACTSEYGLSPVEDPTIGLSPTDDLGDGAAFFAWEAPASDPPEPASPVPTRRRVEDFALGATPIPVADYLFVIDESVSMRHVMRHVRKGFASLRRKDVFPTGARVAVLYTTPADPTDLSAPYPAQTRVGADTLVPGFLDLVDGPRIAAYVAAAPKKYAARFKHPGCTAWFAPTDKNAEGTSCLQAALQVPLLPGRFEAGLVALDQWLDKSAGTPRFRSGAAVNVVFVSDTHDPGADVDQDRAHPEAAADLVAERPDLGQLRARVTEPISAFRIHAIAPRGFCGERWDEASYFDVADDAGGVEADVCTTDDYRPILQQIGLEGSVRQSAVIRLGYPAVGIDAVTVGDHTVEWTPTDDPQAIKLTAGLPATVERLRVAYRMVD